MQQRYPPRRQSTVTNKQISKVQLIFKRTQIFSLSQFQSSRLLGLRLRSIAKIKIKNSNTLYCMRNRRKFRRVRPISWMSIWILEIKSSLEMYNRKRSCSKFPMIGQTNFLPLSIMKIKRASLRLFLWMKIRNWKNMGC